MSLQFYLNSLKLSLKEFFPNTPSSFTKNDFKTVITATFGRTPSDAEVDVIFQGNHEIPRSRIEDIVRDLVYLKRNNLAADVFAILDGNFKGYFDQDDLKRVWAAAAKRLEWKVVLECFQELCPDGTMNYFDFGVVCRNVGLGDEFAVLGDGQTVERDYPLKSKNS